MEFDDHEEDEMDLPPSYDSLPNSSPFNTQIKPRYRECLKNHAVGLGGHALDGCGEFMPAGEEGSLEALKCAACSCHRNFHRKEDAAMVFQQAPFYRGPAGYLHVAPQQRLLALPSTSGEEGSMRKRFRTKFTAEQKGKMLELAEKVGWRIQKQDEELVQHFCDETGVMRHVLKVWMHNNKHTLGKKP